MRALLRFLVLSLGLLLAACDPTPKAPISPNTLVGTESYHVVNKRKQIARITDINGKIITTAIEEIATNRIEIWEEYRGLFRVAGSAPDGDSSFRYELDFDEDELEPLFPVAVGKKVTFRGTLRLLEQSRSFDVWADIKVTAKKTITVEKEKHDVFIIEIFQEISGEGSNEEFRDKIYYDPKISMILRKISDVNGREIIREVKSIKMPSDAATPSRLRQRRSGTVMI